MREVSAALDDRIEMKGLLGAGGMGEVHRAWDRGLERAVAVKFFRGTSPREAERLLLEGRLQARVDHPHVVRVLDVGTLEGRACLVLQLVEGRSLEAVAASLPMEQCVELVRQAATGIHAAHLQGLVHRDVKPGNVLVEEGPGEGRALVSDFGLARGEEPGLTRSGIAPGTLAFMSPEQLMGDGPIGFAADVYGLGATLYAVLAGHPPYFSTPHSTATSEAPSGDPSDLLRRVLEAPTPPLPKSVPPPLARVIAKAMKKHPGSRYESAEALAVDLARFQRGEPVSARPASWAERAASWRRRNRAFARAMGAATAALLVSLGWGVWSTRRADLEALDAARLGALGESMEAELRMEYLSPPHDLRPAFAKVRARVEALKSEAARGRGPASFALGKGLELLGDVEGAREAYERAWAKGFRIPRVAEGLGNALGEQYRQARQRAFETFEPSAREQRLAVLRAELRDPAIGYLTLADSGGWRTAFLRASIALQEGDYPASRSRAAEVLAAEPGRYEALVLQAESLIEEAQGLALDENADEAIATAERAGALIEEASRFARSDPRIARARLRAEYGRLNQLSNRAEPLAESLGAISKSIERAKALDPDDPVVLVLEAKSLLQPLGYGSASLEEETGVAEKAATLLRRAAELDGSQVSTLHALSDALYVKAFFLQKRGMGSLDPVEEGLEAARRATARAPWDPKPFHARSWLYAVEAEILVSLGKSGAQAQRRAVEEAEAALRLGIRGQTTVRRDIGEARIGLAVESWRAGADPRPELEAALTLLDEVLRIRPEAISTVGAAAFGHGTAAELLFAMGVDGRPHLERARALFEGILRGNPGNPEFQGHLAECWAALAAQQAAAGEDPLASVAEAARLFEASRRTRVDNVAFEVNEAVLPLFEAQWQRSRGMDPSMGLAQVERALEHFVQRHPDDPGRALEHLARCALERALLSQQRGSEPVAPARQGLEWLSRTLEKGPHNPELWALQARLHLAAGDREAARASLQRAWSTNPLVKGGPDSRLAEAALGMLPETRAEESHRKEAARGPTGGP